MPVNTEEIIELLSRVADEEKLRVTFKECCKAAAITAGTTAAGGLILGPPGIIIGSIVGGVTATALSTNEFQSVVQVIANMEKEKKEKLAQNVRRIMADVNTTDIILFSAMVAGQRAVRKEVLSAITCYIKDEMQMVIADH